MDLRQITPEFSVCPQISASDVAEIKAAGYRTIICNRPDEEAGGVHDDSDAVAMAAKAAGVALIYLPVISGGMTEANVADMKASLQNVETPVIAYCRSGTRSCFLWALSQAGQQPGDQLIAQAAQAGYDLSPIKSQLG